MGSFSHSSGGQCAPLYQRRGQSARVARCVTRRRYPGAVERSVPRTTLTAEKLPLSDEQRAERLQRLAARLRSPDGLDHDALAQIEELSSDEQ